MNEAEASGVGSITKSATWIGVGLIIIGVLALAVPQQSGMAIAVGVGILLLLSGLLRVVFLFLSPSWGAFLLRLLFGGLSVVAGAMMILDPAFGLKAITIVAIVILHLSTASRDRPRARSCRRARGGVWMMLSGAVSLVLGIFIWRQWPSVRRRGGGHPRRHQADPQRHSHHCPRQGRQGARRHRSGRLIRRLRDPVLTMKPGPAEPTLSTPTPRSRP